MTEHKETVIAVEFGKDDCPHCFALGILNLIRDTKPELKGARIAGYFLQAIVDFVNLHHPDIQSQMDPCIDALRRYFQDAIAAQQPTRTDSFIAPGSNTKQ